MSATSFTCTHRLNTNRSLAVKRYISRLFVAVTYGDFMCFRFFVIEKIYDRIVFAFP